MRPLAPALAACGAALTLAACSSPSSDSSVAPPGAAGPPPRPALFDGSLSTPDQDFALLLVNLVEGNSCTGALVAPNLLLTARHCVSKEDTARGPVECPVEGASYRTMVSTYLPPADAGTFSIKRDFTSKELGAFALKVLIPDTDDPCGRDIAAIVFDRPVPDTILGSLRETPAVVGEVYTAVGLGVIDDENHPPAARLQRNDMQVLGVGPGVVHVDLPSVNHGIPDGDFATTGGVCFGDSGGPILDADNKIVGLASRVVTCAGGPAFYTGITHNMDFIQSALTAADEVLNPTPDAGSEKDDAGDPADEDDASAPDSGPPESTRRSKDSGCSLATTSDHDSNKGTLGLFAMAAFGLLRMNRMRRKRAV